MGDYINNLTKEENHNNQHHHHIDQHLRNGIGYRDDIDTALLLEEKDCTTKSECIMGQLGFQHAQGTDPHTEKAKKQLILAITLCFVFMLAEIIGGYIAGSLAIMADAAHLLSDCVSFIVALIAIWMSRKPPDNRMTFGYKRAEVLGAILSIFGIWILTTFLCYISLNRLIQNDFEIDAHTMMIISGIGILINIVMAFILHGSCSMPHTHSHSHSHDATKQNQRYKPIGNNRRKTENEFVDFENHNNLMQRQTSEPTFILNGSSFPVRSDSICSYRSPSHSRTNSFSKHLSTNNVVLDEVIDFTTPAARSHNNHRQHRDSLDSITSSSTIDQTNDHNNHSHDFHVPNKNINIQAAVIHVLGDFIQSVGVFIAAIIINFYPNAKIVDPLCTFLFSIIVVFTTVRIMKQSLTVILDAVPASIDVQRLTTELNCIPGVRSVHYLNVWSITIDWNVMSVHLVIDSTTNSEKILDRATDLAKEEFDIKHSTIQLERHIEPQLTDALNHHNNTLDLADAMVNFV